VASCFSRSRRVRITLPESGPEVFQPKTPLQAARCKRAGRPSGTASPGGFATSFSQASASRFKVAFLRGESSWSRPTRLLTLPRRFAQVKLQGGGQLRPGLARSV